MRIAVSADNSNGLDSVVAPHFGRCPNFILIDLDGREVKQVRGVKNPFYGQHQPGQVPAFVQSHGANVMLSGGMGQRAIAFFQQHGIEAVSGASGTVHHALEQYLGGRLRGAEPCRESVEHSHRDLHDESRYEKEEVGRLQEEAQMLQQQLDEVMKRLDTLSQDSDE